WPSCSATRIGVAERLRHIGLSTCSDQEDVEVRPVENLPHECGGEMIKRHDLSRQSESLLSAARKVADDNEAAAVVMLAEIPYNFIEIRDLLKKVRLIVTSDKPDVQQAAKDDDVAIVPLQDEPLTRQAQVSQALLEAISD